MALQRGIAIAKRKPTCGRGRGRRYRLRRHGLVAARRCRKCARRSSGRSAGGCSRRSCTFSAGVVRPVNAVQAIESKAQPWYRPTFLKGAVVVLAAVAILPTRANGQFGIDTAAIMAALSKMQSLMNTYIAAPLRTINQYEQSTAKYQQEVMYPLTAINQAKTSVMIR